MKRRHHEVADVLHEHFDSYCRSWPVSAEQRRVVHDLVSCRTASLGGHVLRCTNCDHQEISYNSCRNRHCPKCQGSAAARWTLERCEDLLEVPYFHVVFTLPDELAPVALQNKREVYGLMMRAVAETLSTIAADRRHLGAQVGVIAVLHTWGQTLRHHPHVHCVVPGGGLHSEGRKWVPSRPGFLLPVGVLSCFFRGRFLAGLQELRKADALEFHGQLQPLADKKRWNELLRVLRGRPWVVYSKAPIGGPTQVLKYLARYTHRVAITNRRIRSTSGGQVIFDYRDYSKGCAKRTMRLPAVEFIRRFLLHVLPKGFHRIRYYGFLSNRNRRESVAKIRELLGEPSAGSHDSSEEATTELLLEERTCPACKQGVMVIVAELPGDLGEGATHRTSIPLIPP